MATQAERSTATRQKLLDAAVDALIERGHAGASLPEICRRAGVSRGAQLHHFPTRADLLAAAIEHLFAVRHRAFRASVRATPDLDRTLSLLWEIYTGGALYAWLELVVAARVDPELRRAVAAVDERFEAEAAMTLSTVFGFPPGRPARTAARLVTSLLDGLATNRIVKDDDGPAREVLALAATVLRPMLEGRP